MGEPAWARPFDAVTRRLAEVDALHARLAKWTRNFPDRELVERFQAQGVAAASVLDVADLLSDPHDRARGRFIEATHPLDFRETFYGSYIKASRSMADVCPGPAIGRDNHRVFREILGLSERHYQRLVARQVIY